MTLQGAPDEKADWANLRCSYGSAELVPELLRRAEATGSDVGDEWTDRWSYICHQGTVYSASYAAVPLLTAMCLSRDRHALGETEDPELRHCLDAYASYLESDEFRHYIGALRAHLDALGRTGTATISRG